jgi:hypothetical protein
MAEKSPLHPADIHGLGRLAVEATLGLADLVEAMHHTVASAPGMLGAPAGGRTRGITGLVYGSIRGITRAVGGGIDAILTPLIPSFGKVRSSPERDAMLSALNGVLGDYLVATGNPLALPMCLRHAGQPLDLNGAALAAAIPQPTGRILLLVHGLCLNDLHWRRNGHDHGEMLAEELGYTTIYLRYNSGLHISTNGRALADMVETLIRCWPVPVTDLAIVAHSMGGLISRSGYHYGKDAGHTWPRSLRKIIFLGTPHHGAPLERVGNWVNSLLGASPYSAAFARLGKMRGAGITDLRYGNLLDEDWAAGDRFAHTGDRRQVVRLPDGADCYAIGATLGKAAGDLAGQLLGDGLVPLDSALGAHADPRRAVPFPAACQWIGYGMNHLDLLDRRDVYEQIRRWLVA